MARAQLMPEMHLKACNEAGLLGRIVIALSLEGVDIIHLCAYSSEAGDGHLQIITRDAAKTRKCLSHFIPKVEEREALVVEFENKVGTLAPVARLLGSYGIFIHYVYGTSGDGFKIIGVFSTSDNRRAVELINSQPL